MSYTKRLRKIILLGIIFLGIVSCFSSFTFNISENQIESEFHSSNKIKMPIPSIFQDWEYNISNIGEDVGRDIITDQNGNAYITGKEYNSTRGVDDLIIMKYTHSGVKEWKRSWETNKDSIGYSIDIDEDGNIYVVGYEKNIAQDVDILFLKYDNDGKYQWNTTWGGDEWDIGYGIVVNDTNSIYATGITESYAVFGDVVLLKLNSTGHIKLTTMWGYDDTDCSNDIAIGPMGNIYITGYTNIGIKTNLFLLCYDKFCTYSWNSTWGGSLVDSGESLYIEDLGDIILCGNTKSYGAGANDVVILRYNKSGNLEWNYTWGGIENDYGYGIAKDSHNNSFIVGYTESYGGIDKSACVIKFNATGAFQWYKLWDHNLDDIFYGISIDNSNNMFIAGTSKNADTDFDIIVVRYSPLPDSFILSSNAVNPDHDGDFTLTWTESLDAKNYSLFQYDKPIIEFNDSLIEVVKGNTNRTSKLINLNQGNHYFIVYSYNTYGNISSNCLHIRVLYPPSEFTLSHNATLPETTGQFRLNWSQSERAENYSIYMSNKHIVKIENNGTLIAEKLSNLNYTFYNVENGDYYYIIVSKNDAGINISNCIIVSVRRKPDFFILNSNADNPDNDGKFHLEWSKSNYSKNYTIYYSNTYFDDITGDVEILYDCFIPEFDWSSFKYDVSKGTETYYFRVVAFNDFGNCSSNTLKVIVEIQNLIVSSKKKSSKDDKEEQIEFSPILIGSIVFGGLFGTLTILGFRRASFLKRTQRRPKN